MTKPSAFAKACSVAILLAAIGALLIQPGSAGAAVVPAGTATNQPSALARTNSPAEDTATPQSLFRIPASVQEGRDPFFPESTRVYALNIATKTNQPVVVIDAVLKGIYLMGKHSLATINNHTFEAGEEGDVITESGRVRLRCVEIREESVVVEINGHRKELRLSRGKKL